MSISDIVILLGGVAMFLFGMSLMGDGLKKVAGNRLELILYRLSSTPLKGILLGFGAGLGQGVGLVLSKVGMQHYVESIPEDAPSMMTGMLPFASTMIRAIVGAAGFIALMALQKSFSSLKSASRDRKGLSYALIMTLFGPVIGVSLSLMAVRYTDAGIASTLMALTPVLIIFPYVFIYKQRIKAKEIIGVIVSMAGVALFFLL